MYIAVYSKLSSYLNGEPSIITKWMSGETKEELIEKMEFFKVENSIIENYKNIDDGKHEYLFSSEIEAEIHIFHV